ncbi:MAG TPA: hypothetical protein VHS31_11335 [Tepidisphaeraceae bacterium]|jgi:hypothetical protein|nr:hypothetical protein [Tepidisphaeraceae bacterium]
MKAVALSCLLAILSIQLSCTANSNPTQAKLTSSHDLAKPEVAVMSLRDSVVIAWKPIQDADGYFVYRETQNPPAKQLLGIGPKEAQGFVDHDPPAGNAQYSVQAFKVSDLSEKKQTQGTPAASPIHPGPKQTAKGLAVAERM